MTRYEFISELKNKLALLNEDECSDIIEEYMVHIDMKIKEGKTEAEAINDFGDLTSLADDILAAYHIDKTKLHSSTQQPPEKFRTKIKNLWYGFTGDIRSRIAAIKSAVSRKTEQIKEKREEKIVSEKDRNTDGILKRLFSATANFMKKSFKTLWTVTVNLTAICVKIMGLLCLWAPCAFITVMAVICTIVMMVVYLTTGIGFIGACITGVGLCIMCIAVTLWLTDLLAKGETGNA